MTLTYVRTITETQLGSQIKFGVVNDVKLYQSTYIIASTNMLVFARLLYLEDTFKVKYYPQNAKGQAVYENALYVIVPTRGLFIYDLADYDKEPMAYNHPSLLDIDLVQNPFTGNHFLGLIFDTSDKRDEFFIEIYIQNPFQLVTNKVFCLKSNSIKASLTFDSFFTYFSNENRVYRVRRGVLNRVNHFIYSVELPFSITSLTSYYSAELNLLLPAAMTSNSFQAFEFIQPKTELLCNIQASGGYHLLFSKMTDACAVNIEENRFACCRKIIHYKVRVVGYQLSTTSIVIITVTLAVLALIVIVTVALCCRHNDWCKKNNLKLHIIDKTNRGELYEELADNSIISMELRKVGRNEVYDKIATKTEVNEVSNKLSNRVMTTNEIEPDALHQDKGQSSEKFLSVIVLKENSSK